MEEINIELDSSTQRYIFITRFFELFWWIFLGVGIILIPLWLLGLGQWYSREFVRRFNGLLAAKSLRIKTGVFFRKDTHIPLEKITDIATIQGPIMRYFGLYSLKVETAGADASEGVLLGVLNPKEVRSKILERRDTLIESEHNIENSTGSIETLKDIAETLKRIEKHVAKKS